MMVSVTHPSIPCAFRDVRAHLGGDGQDVIEPSMPVAYGSSYLYCSSEQRFALSYYHTQVVAEDPLAHGFIVRSHGEDKFPNRNWRTP